MTSTLWDGLREGPSPGNEFLLLLRGSGVPEGEKFLGASVRGTREGPRWKHVISLAGIDGVHSDGAGGDISHIPWCDSSAGR